MKNKSNEKILENCEPRRENRNNKGDESTHKSMNDEDDIISRIKIDHPTFDDILDSKIFSDWMTWSTTLIDIDSQRRIGFALLG